MDVRVYVDLWLNFIIRALCNESCSACMLGFLLPLSIYLHTDFFLDLISSKLNNNNHLIRLPKISYFMYMTTSIQSHSSLSHKSFICNSIAKTFKIFFDERAGIFFHTFRCRGGRSLYNFVFIIWCFYYTSRRVESKLV